MSSLRESLQRIYDEHGALTPRVVVAAWRDPDHPDHDRLEWDNTVGGEKYREQQARDLIRSIRVTYLEPDDSPALSVRAWQSVRQQDGNRYEPAETVASDAVLTQIVLMDMRREWRALQQRYGRFKEFTDLVRGSLGDDQAS